MFKNLALLTITLLAPAIVHAQATATASRKADLQVGATFTLAAPNYGTDHWKGYGFFADLDFRQHFGLEAAFHQASESSSIRYERTYEIGPRVLFPIHQRFVPYAKAMVGRGVFNFAGTDSNTQVANLAFNMASFGGGLDIKIRPGLNVRAFDFEYQTWPSFPPRGLNPSVFSFGVAYHFHGGLTK